MVGPCKSGADELKFPSLRSQIVRVLSATWKKSLVKGFVPDIVVSL